MTTVYTIQSNGVEWQTTNTELAEELTNDDARVTAKHHVEVVQQTVDDKGTLVMSNDPDWVQDGEPPGVMADADSWITLDEWE